MIRLGAVLSGILLMQTRGWPTADRWSGHTLPPISMTEIAEGGIQRPHERRLMQAGGEAMCAEEEQERVSLDHIGDRAGLIRTMRNVSFACATCVLETIGSICGETCVAEHLRILLRRPIEPRRCLPWLAKRLSVQGKDVAVAIDAHEPFGLVGPQPNALNDLMVATTNVIAGIWALLYISMGTILALYGELYTESIRHSRVSWARPRATARPLPVGVLHDDARHIFGYRAERLT